MSKLLGRTLCHRLQAACGLLPEDWQDTLRMCYQGCLTRGAVRRDGIAHGRGRQRRNIGEPCIDGGPRSYAIRLT
jgi:hypothetical protein